MKELIKKFPLDIQFFAEEGGENATEADTQAEKATEESSVKDTNKISEKEEVKTVNKRLLDDALSEVSRLKKEAKAKMTEDELKAQELLDKETELQSLRDENKKSKMEATLSISGINADSITKISELAISGNTEELATAINEAISLNKIEMQKEIDKLQLESTKRPAMGSNTQAEIKPDISKMSLDELQALENENPQEFMNI